MLPIVLFVAGSIMPRVSGKPVPSRCLMQMGFFHGGSGFGWGPVFPQRRAAIPNKIQLSVF
jgi:hypothetical protein